MTVPLRRTAHRSWLDPVRVERRETAAIRTSIRSDRSAVHLCVRNAGYLLLAVHDPVLTDHRRRGRAAREPRIHVLGRRDRLVSVNADLYGVQLHRVQWQGQRHVEPLLK